MMVPERVAVLLVVQYQLDRFFAFVDGRLEPADGSPVGVLPLEEPAVSRDDLGARVAGDLDEAVRGEHNRVVGQATEAVAEPLVGVAVRRQGPGRAQGHLGADEAGVDVKEDVLLDALLQLREERLHGRERPRDEGLHLGVDRLAQLAVDVDLLGRVLGEEVLVDARHDAGEVVQDRLILNSTLSLQKRASANLSSWCTVVGLCRTTWKMPCPKKSTPRPLDPLLVTLCFDVDCLETGKESSLIAVLLPSPSVAGL
ncbi:hypothetical protein CTA1_4679 [Colletotrichum tanaceti]|uniref:Uncharacterized protein n=1 Tax=Colletotrichum tanaceti TaxID=1306861 RepID=A0A4U6X6Q2_9PEZI|nr:hypothetical protein CTA1_4679 [Colletotrichum tanaceti]